MAIPGILIVEDEAIVALDIRKSLESLGYHITGMASTGEEALTLARETRPDLVIMDIVLPGKMDGIETAKQIHAETDSPIIYLTAHSDRATVERATETMQYGYLVKPITTNELYSAIETTLQRRKLELQVRDSEEKYRITLNSIMDAVLTTDEHGKIIRMNPAAERLTGWDRDDALGEDITRVITIVDADTKEPVDHPGSRILREGTSIQFDRHMIIRSRDNAERRISCKGTPLRYSENETSGAVLVLQDITEKYRLENELRQAQKMESIGRLAGGVAHDFNNILTTIIGYADLGLKELDEEDPMYEMMKEISAAGKRGSSITQQLLSISRKQVLSLQPLPVNDVLTGMEKMLRRLIGEDVELVIRTDPLNTHVRADHSQVIQVLMNLCINARDAMPGGGVLIIETNTMLIDDSYAQHHPFINPGQYAVLSVSDNGTGMDEETQNHIFEPFFTTKEKNKGTGLGLSTVYGIVKQHNGNILVYSEPGKGTTFRIFLPAIKEKSSHENQVPRELQEELTFKGSILVVEDNNELRKLATNILKRYGFTVMEAGGVKKAIDMAKNNEGMIDLLLTDVVMPKMNGRELFDKISKWQPAMEVLYMSGYTDDIISHHGILQEGVHFIQKPFTVQGLIQKIQQVMKKQDD
ncbi:MAG: response regulator [Spirochaetota bacterium]